jgi:RHS repeat-associated protein
MSNLRVTNLLIAALLFIAGYSSAQTVGYTQSEVIKVSGILTDEQVLGLSNTQKQVSRIYYDGLGRPIQNIALQASPLQRDLIQPLTYDNLGRQVRTYLPYVGKSTDVAGSYRTAAISTDQPGFYNDYTQHLIAQDNAPYVQQVFEDNPLQRVLKAGTAGNGFQPVNDQHYKTVGYRANNAGDGNILIWNPDGSFTTGNYYATGKLSVTDGTDEDNRETLSFTDLSGHLVLKRQILAGGNLDTYYCYNEAGMVSYIIPPKAMVLMAANGNYNLSQAGVNKLIFHYIYNNRGQVIERTVPGKGIASIVYDPLNRPVLAQDAHMIAANKWNYTKYDAQGRAVSQGIYTDAVHTTRAAMQNYVNSVTVAAGYNTDWYETRSSSASTGYYTNIVFPTTGTSPLAYSYYDDYDIENDGTANYTYASQGLNNEGNPTTAPIKNAPTIITTRTLGTGLADIWLLKVVFYDKNGRAIQTQGNNHLNYSAGAITDYATVVYDFMGVAQLSKVTKATGASTTPAVQTAYTYDHANRVKIVSQKYNNNNFKQVANYEYNELGQLVTKKLGLNGSGSVPENLTLDSVYSGTHNFFAGKSIILSPGFHAPAGSVFSASIASQYLQTIDYRYNIRGQLLSVNNSKLANDGGITNADGNDLFGMQFNYEQTDVSLGNNAYFNGRLSAVKWMAKDRDGVSGYERAYAYSYDGVDRYTGATYAERTTASTTSFNVTHGWDEAGITYDAGGNILTLTRNSSTPGTGTATQMDNLQYTYDAANPNRLKSVTDGAGANFTGAGFRNLTGSTGSYSYDDISGNLTADPYKGISGITYNDQNRTQRLSISVTQYIDYTYTASGVLLRKQAYKSGTTTQTTDYIDGFVYNNSSGAQTLAYFAMPEGRVRNDAGMLKQEFVITDQQGNARMSFEDNGSGNAVVRQENSYYGFGLVMTNSSVATLGDANKQLYNGGSEWQNDYGNLPDYYQTFYRNYDAAIGRFIAVDPKAEGAESMTGYEYAGNNPIMGNDPMGDLYQLTRAGTQSMESILAEIRNGKFNRSKLGAGVLFDANGDSTGGGGGGSASSGLSEFFSDVFEMSPSGTSTYSGGELQQAYEIWKSSPSDLFIVSNEYGMIDQETGEHYNVWTKFSHFEVNGQRISANQGGDGPKPLTHAQELAKYGQIIGVSNVSISGAYAAGAMYEYGTIETNKGWLQKYQTVYSIVGAGYSGGGTGGQIIPIGNNKPTFSDWQGWSKGASISYLFFSVSAGKGSTYYVVGAGLGLGYGVKSNWNGTAGMFAYTFLIGNPYPRPPVDFSSSYRNTQTYQGGN